MQAADNVMCLYRYCNDANEGEGTSCLIMYINTHWLAVPSLNAGEGEGEGEGRERERRERGICCQAEADSPPGSPARWLSLLPIHQPPCPPRGSSLFRSTKGSAGAEAKGWSRSANPDVPAAAPDRSSPTRPLPGRQHLRKPSARQNNHEKLPF